MPISSMSEMAVMSGTPLSGVEPRRPENKNEKKYNAMSMVEMKNYRVFRFIFIAMNKKQFWKKNNNCEYAINKGMVE